MNLSNPDFKIVNFRIKLWSYNLETLKQEESISVANKLARIKKLKTDIQLFLSNQGIIIPNV